MTKPLKPFLVLAFVIFSVFVYSIVGPVLLGQLGQQAKTSQGSDSEGFSVSNSTIDRGAKIALVHVPSFTIAGIGIWALLSLLVVLAYVGAV